MYPRRIRTGLSVASSRHVNDSVGFGVFNLIVLSVVKLHGGLEYPPLKAFCFIDQRMRDIDSFHRTTLPFIIHMTS